ncbi:MAG: hypothetical protein HYZ34_02365 [Ignavibacteriae bacterium]|nr:hypothetical protein [Ignavibacteriota bacterium]
MQQYLDNVKVKLSDVDGQKKTLQGLTKEKNQIVSDAKQFFRNLANKIKTHDSYTQAIGETLGIIAPEDTSMQSINDATPEFWLTALSDHIRVDWKKGIFDGVKIMSKRGNETIFTQLNTDNYSPYEDTRKNLVAGVPEMREYQLIYLLDDKEVGKPSAVKSIVCNL